MPLHLILTSCASACGRLTFNSSRGRRRLHRRRISGIKLRRQADGIRLPPTARPAIHGSKAVLTAGKNRPTTATLSWRLCTKFDPWTLGATLCRQDVALCTVGIIITTEYPNFAVVTPSPPAAGDELLNGKIFYTLREAQIHLTRIQAASTGGCSCLPSPRGRLRYAGRLRQPRWRSGQR